MGKECLASFKKQKNLPELLGEIVTVPLSFFFFREYFSSSKFIYIIHFFISAIQLQVGVWTEYQPHLCCLIKWYGNHMFTYGEWLQPAYIECFVESIF